MANGTVAVDAVVDSHWDVTQAQGRDISEIKTDVAGLKVGIAGLREQNRAGFDQIQQVMAQHNQPKPPFPMLAVAALVVSVSLGIGGFVSWMFSDMQRESDLRFENVEEDRRQNREAHIAIYSLLRQDDARELKDAASMGALEARLDARRAMDNYITQRRDKEELWVRDRLSRMDQQTERNYTGLQAFGDYLKEHANKRGAEGHPAQPGGAGE